MKKKRLVEEMDMSYIRKMGNIETNETENELIILLPVGCYWAKKTGGCSYCGYQPLVNHMHESYNIDSYIDILKHEVKKQETPFERISFFVGGSFFEIPKKERNELFEYVNTLEHVNEVFIETRPELFTKEDIKELKELLDDKKMWVALGLETHDTYIRNKIHKKGISDESFLNALEILNELDVNSLIYVFLKPPIENITDKEAFDEGMETIKYCFENGATAIELESGYIVENSYIEKIYNQGKYTPLKLWTIKHLLKEANELNLGPIRLAYFTDTPEPIDGPKNCSECTEEVKKILQEYRLIMNPETLHKEVKCDCKEEWEKII